MIKNKLTCLKFSAVVAVVLAFFVLCPAPARAGYYAQGVLESKNILSGADVTAIASFEVTAVIPASTTASVKFSQDKVNYYNSSGTKGGWDNLADGANTVDLSSLSWTGGLLFYKLKFTTTKASTTPVAGSIAINYTGTAVPAISGITYHNQGIAASGNLLSGATVSAINGFLATSTVPAGTFVYAKFSQDKTHYYSASGTPEGWSSLSNGATTVNLTGLGWSAASFYYKIKTESLIDNTLQPKISAIGVDYDGGAVPPAGTARYAESTVVSTNLLAGFGDLLAGDKYFVYNLTSLPYGTHAYAQFSTDGLNWYNSSAELRGWDSLLFGDHLSYGSALNLERLNLIGSSTFYYKLRLNTTVDNTVTPILKKAGLLRRIAKVNSDGHPGGGAVTVNTPQTDRLTGGLAGIWSFDGRDVAGNTAFDRSGNGHNGTIFGASVFPGKNGQALSFDGTADYVNLGNVASGIKTIAFWMKADDTTSRKVLDIDGTDQIELNGSGQIAATGWPAATVYVDGVATSSLDTDWHLVAVTDTTGVNGTAVDLGRVGGGYFQGALDEVRFYDRVLSPDEIAVLVRLGRIRVKR